MDESDGDAMPTLLASDSSDSEPAGLMTDEDDDGDWRVDTYDDGEYAAQPLVCTYLPSAVLLLCTVTCS